MVVRGGWLLLLMMLSLTVYDLGRSFLPDEEQSALVVTAPVATRILLSGTVGQLDGIHQINDAAALVDVINLANLHFPAALRRELRQHSPFADGKSFKFQLVKGEIVAVNCGWMPAAMRMALAIPLRTERMTLADWDDLPGAGPSLAQRIVLDRQENGEFKSFSELGRVKGVGLRRLERWRPFFYVH